MQHQKTTVKAKDGLHARPVGEIVRTVKSFPGTTVALSTETKKVNAASMIGILSLGLKAGSEVTVEAEGPDEVRALADVIAIIESSQTA